MPKSGPGSALLRAEFFERSQAYLLPLLHLESRAGEPYWKMVEVAGRQAVKLSAMKEVGAQELAASEKERIRHERPLSTRMLLCPCL